MIVNYIVGTLIDVYDHNNETFCPASIVNVVCNKSYIGDIKSVRIHYLGLSSTSR